MFVSAEAPLAPATLPPQRGAMAWRACSFVAVGIFASLLHAPTAAADLAAALPDWLASDATGPLHDAQCNMETVEEANAAQLHTLLVDISETTFFRLIHVNMENTCQYWRSPQSPADDDAAADDEFECESKAEDTAVPLCTLGTDESTDPFGAPFGAPPFGAPSLDASLPGALGGAVGPGGGPGGVTDVTDAVDSTITPAEDAAQGAFIQDDCNNEELPTFWLDICKDIPTNASGNTPPS